MRIVVLVGHDPVPRRASELPPTFPDPQPATVTLGAFVRNPAAQKLTFMESLVPTGILKRDDNGIAISVNRKGPFPPSKYVKVEKIELHLKQPPLFHSN